jgi:hypothetical protein
MGYRGMSGYSLHRRTVSRPVTLPTGAPLGPTHQQAPGNLRYLK